ncbi:hypothetical protein [Secundilactobacillus kimchicus]|uniref:Surface layer protein slpd n=1 Tax=Secundilactobacillus kimchicus JCM 15530 TaxID=1302272 RepID=A0A0R1HNG1_9LACO|nr:hypothetical protein [Secundilactobacillus kimchicus]KRK47960.1 surface layer protein slpd [Secundilactobacillus kimchicus JCM 15530]MBT9671437.1 S-layer protein [Secundilactobacillus kimchicus]
MKSSLKKSLFISAVALGAITAATATNASAKRTTVVTNTTLDASSSNIRNYTATGSNALYTKAAGLKSARQVVSGSTLANYNAKQGQGYLRAYRLAKLSNGNYYMKVVTFDKTYRGWIYVGKTNPSADFTKVSGGLTNTATTKESALTDTEKTQAYQFKTVGTTNDGTQLTYKAPMWTQYKLGRQVTDSTAYKADKLTVTKAVTRTREGDRWVYVEDANHPEVSGWILDSALTKFTGVDPDKSVGNDQTTVDKVYGRILYDPTTGGKTAGTENWKSILGIFHSNDKFTAAVKKFNADANVKGNKKDVLPQQTLKDALTKDGLATVYMKVSPTILPRIQNGFIDSLGLTGVYMKFTLDTDSLPSVVHYGDKVRLNYQLADKSLYMNANFGIGANADGMIALPNVFGDLGHLVNAAWGTIFS